MRARLAPRTAHEFADDRIHAFSVERIDIFCELLELFSDELPPESLPEFRDTIKRLADAAKNSFDLLRQEARTWRGHCFFASPAKLARDPTAAEALLETLSREYPDAAARYARILARHRRRYRAPLQLVKR